MARRRVFRENPDKEVARVANLRAEPENCGRASTDAVDAGGTNGRLKIMSTYPIFRLLVVRSDGAFFRTGGQPRPQMDALQFELPSQKMCPGGQ